MDKKYDIYDRAFAFAVRVAKFIDRLPKKQSIIEYSRQLTRASGSIGANIEEADGTLTKKDFINKLGIARRESKESRHWLRLIERVAIVSNKADKDELGYLIGEAKEILLILSSIINNTKK